MLAGGPITLGPSMVHDSQSSASCWGARVLSEESEIEISFKDHLGFSNISLVFPEYQILAVLPFCTVF